jgi:hypothetical protein
MKVRVKDTENGCVINQIHDDGTETLLRNVRAATLSLDAERESLVELRLDLATVECAAIAQVTVADKEGRLRQVKRIEYVDGGEDLYA